MLPSDASMDKLISLEASIASQEIRLRQLDRDLNAVKQFLRIAARYENEDVQKLVSGIQAALGKAAESKGRQPRKKGK